MSLWPRGEQAERQTGNFLPIQIGQRVQINDVNVVVVVVVAVHWNAKLPPTGRSDKPNGGAMASLLGVINSEPTDGQRQRPEQQQPLPVGSGMAPSRCTPWARSLLARSCCVWFAFCLSR